MGFCGHGVMGWGAVLAALDDCRGLTRSCDEWCLAAPDCAVAERDFHRQCQLHGKSPFRSSLVPGLLPYVAAAAAAVAAAGMTLLRCIHQHRWGWLDETMTLER